MAEKREKMPSGVRRTYKDRRVRNEAYKGYDEQWLLGCCVMAGKEGTYGTLANITKQTHLTLLKRRDEPDLWTRGQMYKIAKACNMTSYDIMRIWFNDLVIEEENDFYADVLQIMADKIRKGKKRASENTEQENQDK